MAYIYIDILAKHAFNISQIRGQNIDIYRVLHLSVYSSWTKEHPIFKLKFIKVVEGRRGWVWGVGLCRGVSEWGGDAWNKNLYRIYMYILRHRNWPLCVVASKNTIPSKTIKFHRSHQLIYLSSQAPVTAPQVNDSHWMFKRFGLQTAKVRTELSPML